MSKNLKPFFLLAVFLFLSIYLFTVGTFFLSELVESANTPFWTDERNGFNSSIKGSSFFDLLIHGAKGQGSRVPLDYMACKILYQIKDFVNYFNFTEDVYYRLFAISIMIFCMIAILFIFLRDINREEDVSLKATQLFLLTCVPFATLYTMPIYEYAHLMRPYSLWAASYLFVLSASLVDRNRNGLLLGGLIILALSSTGAILQILTLMIGFIIVFFVQKKEKKEATRFLVKVFAPALIIGVYYLFPMWQGEDFTASFSDFFDLWKNHAVLIPIMLFAIIFCLAGKRTKKYAVAPIGFLLMFLIGPAIFWKIKSNGLFFTRRQYVYYEFTAAVFLLTTIKYLPYYYSKVRLKYGRVLILLFTCVIACLLTFKSKNINRFKTAQANMISLINNQTPVFKK